jgi:hypothetical protein
MENNSNLDKAEKFLIVEMGRRHPEIQRSTRLRWAVNYNLEKEVDDLFNADEYVTMLDRARAMFDGMPEAELQTVALMMCRHRSKPIEKGGHSEDREEETKELEAVVTEPELVELSKQVFWSN